MPKVFFTSDLHFYHKNIIEYCARPFKNLDEMHVTLINNWNSVVSNTDKVFVLGDFSFGNKQETANIVSQLKGYKVLILGNHDKSSDKMLEAGFNETHDYFDYNGWFLCHYPLDKRSHIKQLCGHVHEKWVSRGASINVGVDVWDYLPHTLEQLVTLVSKKDKELQLKVSSEIYLNPHVQL